MVTKLENVIMNHNLQGMPFKSASTGSAMSVATERESRDSSAGGRPARPVSHRGFIVPDAAMPGPLTRFSPFEEEEGSAGGDSMEDHDAQNQDRI